MTSAPYRIWGRDLEATALDQMKNACALPVAVGGALMPDAHQGYGLRSIPPRTARAGA